jgi:spore maturation protein CgeB
MTRIFGVDVTFRSAGDMFTHGFRNAGRDMGVEYRAAQWDDPKLPDLVKSFNPDLLLVIHGRDFTNNHKDRFNQYKTAVWLVDEPYEVDDSASFSGQFDYVFVNDPNTLDRHKNAVYLPTCYDPFRHYDAGLDRKYDVGFIGLGSKTRVRYLREAAKRKMLSYLVGGPWVASLKKFSIGDHKSPAEVAELYQQTKIVINVWRDKHHFNREKIPAYSMNPRIYEALACGALVISEPREEITKVFPGLPTFKGAKELVGLLEYYLDEDQMRESCLAECRARLAGHTYGDRLKTILEACKLTS